MSDSIAQIKEELQALNLSTSTPGVVGEERMEALRMRLEVHKAKTLMKGGISAANSASGGSMMAFPSLEHLSMSELKSRLKQLDGDTSTPGLSGEERREELTRRLVQAICGGTPTPQQNDVMDGLVAGNESEFMDFSPRESEADENRRQPFASHMPPTSLESLSTIESEIRDLQIDVPEPIMAPPARMVAPVHRHLPKQMPLQREPLQQQQGSPEAKLAAVDIGELKRKIKRISNKRAVAVAARLSGEQKDITLKEHEKAMHQCDAEIARVRLLKGRGGGTSSSMLIDGGAMKSHDALIAALSSLKADKKLVIKERRAAIKVEEDENPEHSAVEEKELNDQIIAANLQRGRTRRRMNEARDLDKKIEGGDGFGSHNPTVAELAAQQASPEPMPGAMSTVANRKFAKAKAKTKASEGKSIQDSRFEGLEREADSEKDYLAKLLAELDEQEQAWNPDPLDDDVMSGDGDASFGKKGDNKKSKGKAEVSAKSKPSLKDRPTAGGGASPKVRSPPALASWEGNDGNKEENLRPSPPSSSGQRLKSRLSAALAESADGSPHKLRRPRPESGKSTVSVASSHPDRLDEDYDELAEAGIELSVDDLNAELDEPIPGLDSVGPGHARVGGQDGSHSADAFAVSEPGSARSGVSAPSTARSESTDDDDNNDSGDDKEAKNSVNPALVRGLRQMPKPPSSPPPPIDLPGLTTTKLSLDTGIASPEENVKNPAMSPADKVKKQPHAGHTPMAGMQARLDAALMPDPSDDDNDDDSDDSSRPIPVKKLIEQRMKEAMMLDPSSDEEEEEEEEKQESALRSSKSMTPKAETPTKSPKRTLDSDTIQSPQKMASRFTSALAPISNGQKDQDQDHEVVPPPRSTPPPLPGPPSEPHPMASRRELFSAGSESEPDSARSEIARFTMPSVPMGIPIMPIARPTAVRAELEGVSSDSDDDDHDKGKKRMSPRGLPSKPLPRMRQDDDGAIVVGDDSDEEDQDDLDQYPSPRTPSAQRAPPANRRAPPSLGASEASPPTEPAPVGRVPGLASTRMGPPPAKPTTRRAPPMDSPPESPESSEKSDNDIDHEHNLKNHENKSSNLLESASKSREDKGEEDVEGDKESTSESDAEEDGSSVEGDELKQRMESNNRNILLTPSGHTPAIERALEAAKAETDGHKAQTQSMTTPTSSRILSHPMVARVVMSDSPEDMEGESGISTAFPFEEDDNYDASRIKITRKQAQAWVHVGNYEQAESTYQEALMLDPLDVRTLECFASFLNRKKGDIARAESFYRRALQICVPGLLDEVARRDKISSPEQIRPTVEQSTPEDIAKRSPPPSQGQKISVKSIVSLLLSYAQFLSRAKGDVEATLLVYRRAVKVAPKDGQALAAFAHFLAEEGGSISIASPVSSPGVDCAKQAADEAAALFQDALKVCPGNPLIALWYAKFLKKKKKFAEADLMYQVALSKSSSDSVKRRDRSEKGDKSIRATVMCNYGAFLWRSRGNMAAGHDMLEAGLKEFPTHRGLIKAKKDFLKAADL